MKPRLHSTARQLQPAQQIQRRGEADEAHADKAERSDLLPEAVVLQDVGEGDLEHGHHRGARRLG